MSTVNPAPFQEGDFVECEGRFGTVITQILNAETAEWGDVYVNLDEDAKNFAVFDGTKTKHYKL
jgi:hypothetical protein